VAKSSLEITALGWASGMGTDSFLVVEAVIFPAHESPWTTVDDHFTRLAGRPSTEMVVGARAVIVACSPHAGPRK
jgi:hypothetical protein